MTTQNVPRRPVAETLSDILASPEVSRLTDELEATRETGRPGYPLRAMIGMALAKSLYALPCWTRVVRLVREHPALVAVIAPDGNVPSQWACYRFTAKLRAHTDLLETCIASVVKELKRRDPLLGWDVAIDASDMPAYANGQRFKSKGGRERALSEYSDPDASLGAPLGRLDAEGRRLLRLPAAHGRVLQDGPSAGVAGRDGQGKRSSGRRAAARQAAHARNQARDVRNGQGLRPWPRL